MTSVIIEVTLENLDDVWTVRRGDMHPEQARKIVVDALVDFESRLLSLPTRMIRELGLQLSPTTFRIGEATMYDAVHLTVQGRTCTTDVIEVPDTVPVLIGQIPLEHLDFIIEMRSQSLVGNPAHGGEHMYEMF